MLFSCCVVSSSLQPMDCSTPGFPVLHCLLEFAQNCVHWVQPSHPLSLPSSLALSLSQHRGLFQWVGFSHQVVKVLELQLQHQSFQWIFRFDWLDLFAVLGALKSLQHHSLKALILWQSAFFIVQLSCLYMTAGKTVSLTIWIFVDKWCLCFLTCCLGSSYLFFQGAIVF